MGLPTSIGDAAVAGWKAGGPSAVSLQLDARIVERLPALLRAYVGSAVDLLVEDEDMPEVARLVAENTTFDRLYFYGPDRPIHVSQAPKHNRQAVIMRERPSGRLVPPRRKPQEFLEDPPASSGLPL